MRDPNRLYQSYEQLSEIHKKVIPRYARRTVSYESCWLDC